MKAISADQTSGSTRSTRHGLALALCASLRQAMHRSRLSREEIALELTKRIGRKISLATMDAWAADTKTQYHLPAECIPALCEILQDDAIQRQLLSPEMRHNLELGESPTKVAALTEQSLAKLREIESRRKGGLALAARGRR